MKNISIELERNELRRLKIHAAQQLRTPENLAKFLILKNLGFIDEDVTADLSANSKTPTALVSEAEPVSAFAGIHP